MKEFEYTPAKLVTTTGEVVGTGVVQPHHEGLALLLGEELDFVPGTQLMADLDSNRIAMRVTVSYAYSIAGIAFFGYPPYLQVEAVDPVQRQAEGTRGGPILLKPQVGSTVTFVEPMMGSLSVVMATKVELDTKIVIGCRVTSGNIRIHGKIVFVGQTPEPNGWRYGIKVTQLTDEQGADIPLARAAEALRPSAA